MSDIYVTRDEYNDLLAKFSKLQKQMKKVLKVTKKEDLDESKPKKLCGFAKPTQISEQLAAFLKIDKNELIARTQVTKLINAYVKENGLQNPENKREIKMNDALKELVDIPEDVQLSFFNLQKYIKHHYPVAVPEEKPAVPEEKPAVPIKKTVRKKVVKK